MKKAMPILALILGALAGFLARPPLAPSPDSATSRPAAPDSASARPAAPAASPGDGAAWDDLPEAFAWPDDSPDAGDVREDLRARYGSWRFRRDPRSAGPPPPAEPKPEPLSTVGGLRAALLDPDRCRGAEGQRLAHRLVHASGYREIPPELTLALLRGGRSAEARITVRGWNDEDLLDGLSRAVAEREGGERRFRSLVASIVSVLHGRDGVRVPDELVRRLAADGDPRLRVAAASICMFPRDLRANLLIELLRGERNAFAKAHAVECLAELVEDGLVPPGDAAHVVLEAARSPRYEVREVALRAFPLLGPPAVAPALRLLADPGFLEAAPDETRQALVRTVAAAGRLGELAPSALDSRLAHDLVAVLSEVLEDDPERYARIAGTLPRLLALLPPDDEEVSWLFSVADDCGDEVFVLASARNRALPWSHRLAALKQIYWDEDRRAAARAVAAGLIRDRSDSPALRIRLAADLEPPEDPAGRADWLATLRQAAEGDPSEWVRLALAEIVREYED